MSVMADSISAADWKVGWRVVRRVRWVGAVGLSRTGGC